jgi:4'-phosphopantetheinyl transferase
MFSAIRWEDPPRHLALEEQEVHIWRADLDSPTRDMEWCWQLLSAEEVERAGRFRNPRDAERYSTAHGLLRSVLERYTGQAAREIRFSQNSHGKPKLVSAGPGSALQFNLSHSQDLAVFAFSGSNEIGIDVEKIRDNIDFKGIAERYFSARENEELQELPRELRQSRFFAMWTCKEAYAKARGEGLVRSLSSFSVALSSGEKAVEVAENERRWTIVPFEPRAGFPAACAVESGDGSRRFFQFA